MIDVFISNLAERQERKNHIIHEFIDRPEFNVHIEKAMKNKIGSFGLWQTFQKIVAKAKERNNHYFIFCEDDHSFTEMYFYNLLVKDIQAAISINANLLIGGASWHKSPIQISKRLYWVEAFNGMQFTIIFKNAYDIILNVDAHKTIITDMSLSRIFENKFIIHPFISIQKEFGYSDVTKENNNEGRVERLFKETSEGLESLKKVRKFYLPDFKK